MASLHCMKDRRHELYYWVSLKRKAFNGGQTVKLANEDTPSFTIVRAGKWREMKRVVEYHGQTVALIEGGLRPRPSGQEFNVTISPGVDPVLIVCICAIQQEMDVALAVGGMAGAGII